MDEVIAHLQMLQSVIDRLAGNAFLLKGWAITLMAAVFALADPQSKQVFSALAFIPVAAFWILDGYYLFIERRYRDLYEDIVAKKATNLSMKLPQIGKRKYAGDWLWACGAPCSVVFYAVLLVSGYCLL